MVWHPMQKVFIIKHFQGAIGLRLFGLGPNFKPVGALLKLQKLLHRNAFWAKDRKFNDLRKCLNRNEELLSL